MLSCNLKTLELEVSLLRDKDVMLQMDEKAKEQACRQLEEKRMKTAEDLKHKQLLQKENMRRLVFTVL